MHFPSHKLLLVKSILFVLLFVSFGCQKSEELSTYDILLPQQLKDVFLFQSGTYWIMEQNNGGNVLYDSIYVTETLHDSVDIINPGTQQAYAKKEVFNVRCTSTYYKREFSYVSQSADLCNNLSFREPCHFVAMELYKNDVVTASSRIYYYPDQVDAGWSTHIGSSDNTLVKIDAIFDNYLIGDKTYAQVRQVLTEKDRTSQGKNSIRYFAPGYGLIAYSVPELKTDWKLVRSKIVRD